TRAAVRTAAAMSEDGPLRAGRRIAELLAGSWRAEVRPASPSDSLADLVPLLARGGVAALAWRRLGPIDRPGLRALRDAARANALGAALQRRAVRGAMAALERPGIHALLGKGLAAAHLYPNMGYRPTGDVDLYVAPSTATTARAAVATVTGAGIDLHAGAAELDDRPWDDVVARSAPIDLDGAPIPTFGREDHLRLMALHMLRHGAWRPLWLCDVAAAAESDAHGLDWDRVLGGDRRRAEGVASTLRLAEELL